MRTIKSKKFSFLILTLIVSMVVLTTDSWAIVDQERKAKSLTSYTMGVIYDFHGMTEDAIDEFKNAAEFEENYAVHLRLGADYARVGKLSEAIGELRTVLDLDPANVQARYLLALIYSTQKEFNKAAEEYEAILTSFSKAEPENVEIYGYLGQLYYSQKEYEKAIKQYEIILSINTDNTDILFILGSLYLEIENNKKAIDLFSRAVQLDPEFDIALNSLGYIYAETGSHLEEAMGLIQRALKIDPNNGAYLDSLGWVYYKMGKYEDAIKYLKRADDILKDPVIYEHLGDVYFDMKKSEDAKKYWQLSIELLPEQDRVLRKLKEVD